MKSKSRARSRSRRAGAISAIPAPDQWGFPAAHPKKKRFSIEAIGGDAVGAIEKLLGESILWAEEGRLPAHFILIGALLKKSRP